MGKLDRSFIFKKCKLYLNEKYGTEKSKAIWFAANKELRLLLQEKKNIGSDEKMMVLPLCALYTTMKKMGMDDSSHFINVLGKESGQYVICDGYVPTRDATVFYGNMEEQDLYSAWADKEYEYVLIEKLPDKTETELLTEIESSLVKSIRTYCSGGCEDNVIWGKDAIYEMFKEIQAHIDKEGAYEVNYQLRIYGFLATKKMLLSMLQKEVRWQTVALQYEEIVQEWDCICMFFLKAVLSRKDELYERLLVRVQKCIESEVLILEQVIEVGGVSCRNLRFVMG